MNHLPRASLVSVLLLILLTMALPAFAQGSVTVVANANLNLRASPDSSSQRFATVPYQTELTANYISSDRNWVAVVYNGQAGWISLAYTGVVSGSLGSLPVSDQTFTVGGGQAVTSNVIVAMAVNLRYRTEPNLDLRPAGAIPYQTQVPALGLSADGLFVLVHYNGQNVWVYREYVVEVAGSLDSFVPGAVPVGAGAAPASNLTPGSMVTGVLNAEQPRHDYPIHLSAGQQVTIMLVATSGNLDPYLYLLNTSGQELASNDDIDYEGGNYNSRIQYTAPQDGLYIIRAARYEGNYVYPDGTVAPANTSGEFLLTVQ